MILFIDHICESPGCKSMLVLDGNMKNARQVCMVKDVAELHFSAINGSIVVGKCEMHNSNWLYIVRRVVILYNIGALS